MVARISYLIFLITGVFSAYSQDTLNYRIVDSASYNLFIDQKWDSLILTGKKAIMNGIEYFYLDHRMGVAYFENGNYMKAAHFFEKALQLNSDDEASIKYLFFSYILTGRESDAALLSSSYRYLTYPKLTNKLNRLVDFVYFETGPGLSNNQSKNGNIDISGNEHIYGEIDGFKNMYYTHLGLHHRINKRISLYHGYSNIIINNVKEIRFEMASLPPFSQDRILTYNYKLYQNSYYLSCQIQFKNGFSITPAFHFINDGYTDLQKNVSSIQSLTESNFSYENFNLNNFIYSVNFNKVYSIFNFNFSASLSDFGAADFFQPGIAVALYPFGNNNFSLSSGIDMINQLQASPGQQGHFVYTESLSCKISSKIWLTGRAAMNDLTMYNGGNGFVVYNVPDRILSKYEVICMFSISKRIELTLTYQFMEKENDYFYYSDLNTEVNNSTHYNNNLIITGIKWNL